MPLNEVTYPVGLADIVDEGTLARINDLMLGRAVPLGLEVPKWGLAAVKTRRREMVEAWVTATTAERVWAKGIVRAWDIAVAQG